MNLTPLGPILQRHESTLQSMHNNAVAKSQLAARQVYKYPLIHAAEKVEISPGSSNSRCSSRGNPGKSRLCSDRSRKKKRRPDLE